MRHGEPVELVHLDVPVQRAGEKSRRDSAHRAAVRERVDVDVVVEHGRRAAVGRDVAAHDGLLMTPKTLQESTAAENVPHAHVLAADGHE